MTSLWCHGKRKGQIQGVAQFGGALLCDLGQRPHPLCTLSLWKPLPFTPGLQALCASIPPPLSTGPGVQASPIAWQAVGGGSWQGGKRREGQESQELAGPRRLLNWGAWPGQPPQAPTSTSPPSLLALHCKHSWPTSAAAAPEGGTAADTARGHQKHLTPSLLPGRAFRREDGLGGGARVPGL